MVGPRAARSASRGEPPTGKGGTRPRRRVVDLMHRLRDDDNQRKKTNLEELHVKCAARACGLEVNRDSECA